MTCVSVCDLKASRRFLCRGFNVLAMFTKLAHDLSKRHDLYFNYSENRGDYNNLVNWEAER